MEDIIKSIKAFLYERNTSPLFGAFVCSWSVWNYAFFMIVFSDMRYEDKISHIDKLFEGWSIYLFGYVFYISGHLINGFLLPLIYSSIYIFVYPYLAKPIYEFSLTKSFGLKDVRRKVEGKSVVTVEEAAELYLRLNEMQERYAADLGEANKELVILRQELRDKKIKSLSEKADVDTSDDMSRIEEVALSKMSELRNYTSFTLYEFLKNEFPKMDKAELDRANDKLWAKLNDGAHREIHVVSDSQRRLIIVKDTFQGLSELGVMVLDFVQRHEFNPKSDYDALSDALGKDKSRLRLCVNDLRSTGFLTPLSQGQEERYLLSDKSLKVLDSLGLLPQ